MSFAFQRQTRQYGKRALAYGLGLVAFGGLSTMNYLNRVASSEEAKVNKAKRALSTFTPYTVPSSESVQYPWAQGNLDDWEYKLVKIRGYFKEHRIYVRRRKDGKDGYAVFAPFITASENLSPDPTAPVEHPQIAEHGVMVNLGWIPVENKNEVKGTDEPLPLVEWDGENMPHNYVDPHSGFIYKTKYNEETEVKPKYTDLTAIVRRGESWNPLIGNVNFPKDKLFQFVDLDLFSRVFLFNNHDTSRAAYLERIVPSLDESETAYPIAATKENFLYDTNSPSRYRSLASRATIASVGSLGLMLPLLLL